MLRKDDAQRRADQISAFKAELSALDDEGIFRLDDDERARIEQHHASLLKGFTRTFDIDVSGADKQLSWGMRIVSFLGALALSAAVFFFFYRFWGFLHIPVQVGILVAAPLLTSIGVEIAARREKTLYFASLFALVAFACFVLNLSVLGVLFNITPSQNAFLAWGGFALILAYTYGLRLLLVAGISCVAGYLAATVGTWSGCYWLSFGERPENFIIAGALLTTAAVLPQRHYPTFPAIYRVYGLLMTFIAVLILANWGSVSYLPWSSTAIENAYQIFGFVLAAGAISVGIRRNWPGTTNLGCTFFVLYLYTKLFDWWWDWLPKYLFFLLLGLIAVALLLVLKRIRGMTRRGVA